MRIILGNAFSLQMLDLQRTSNVEVTPLTVDMTPIGDGAVY